MTSSLNVIGLCGSLRRESHNRTLLNSMVDMAPAGLTIQPWDWSEIPHYNGDLEDAKVPASVVAIREAVQKADGLLIVTPEYNYGMPGALRNTLDWLSRPGFKSPLAGKKVAHCGASPGGIGTARAQEQVKLFCCAVLALPFPHPGLLVRECNSVFKDGKVVDEETADRIARYLGACEAWLRA